jgi:hypothetical protein
MVFTSINIAIITGLTIIFSIDAYQFYSILQRESEK